MKDMFCVAAVVGKVLCLVVFVSALRPGVIGAMEADQTSLLQDRALPSAGM